jgi:hypothetical protein
MTEDMLGHRHTQMTQGNAHTHGTNTDTYSNTGTHNT